MQKSFKGKLIPICLLVLFLSSCKTHEHSCVFEMAGKVYQEYSKPVYRFHDKHLDTLVAEFMDKHSRSEYYVLKILDNPLLRLDSQEVPDTQYQILLGTYSPRLHGNMNYLFPKVGGFVMVRGIGVFLISSESMNCFLEKEGKMHIERFEIGPEYYAYYESSSLIIMDDCKEQLVDDLSEYEDGSTPLFPWIVE